MSRLRAAVDNGQLPDAATQLPSGDIKLIFDSGIRTDDDLLLYSRDIYVDLGLPPRLAGLIVAGRSTTKFHGIKLAIEKKGAEGNFVEVHEPPPISYSSMQKFLTGVQAVEVQMPGKAPFTPDSMILGDNLEYKVLTRETLADRVKTLEGFNKNVILGYEGTCKSAAVQLAEQFSGPGALPLQTCLLVDSLGRIREIDAAAYTPTDAVVVESKAQAKVKDVDQLDEIKKFITGRELTGEGVKLQGKHLHLFLHSNSLPTSTETQDALLRELSSKQYGLLLPSGDSLTNKHWTSCLPTAMLNSSPGTSRVTTVPRYPAWLGKPQPMAAKRPHTARHHALGWRVRSVRQKQGMKGMQFMRPFMPARPAMSACW
ncbi:g9663 [Coccomyxa viridis]|uniref:G9663 protein n=1 Tax=Coccomyxa viridis TaxID=1274662 RepID=A0ABP1G662_9CHLO